MKRRNFISVSALSGIGLLTSSSGYAGQKKGKFIENIFSSDTNRFTVFTSAPVKPVKIFHITDTHLSLTDDREIPFQAFSNRRNARKFATITRNMD